MCANYDNVRSNSNKRTYSMLKEGLKKTLRRLPMEYVTVDAFGATRNYIVKIRKAVVTQSDSGAAPW